MSGQFAKLEFRLLRAHVELGLEHKHVLFLALIAAFDYDGKGHSWRGQQTYADLMGVSVRTIGRWTKHLEKQGLIEVYRRERDDGRRGTNEISWYGLSEALASLDPDDTQASGAPDTTVADGNRHHQSQPCHIDGVTHLSPGPPDIHASDETDEAQSEEGETEEGHVPAGFFGGSPAAPAPGIVTDASTEVAGESDIVEFTSTEIIEDADVVGGDAPVEDDDEEARFSEPLSADELADLRRQEAKFGLRPPKAEDDA